MRPLCRVPTSRGAAGRASPPRADYPLADDEGVFFFFAAGFAVLPAACAPRCAAIASALALRSRSFAVLFELGSPAFSKRLIPPVAASEPRTTALCILTTNPGCASVDVGDESAAWAATLLPSTSRSDSDDAM